MAMMLRHVNLIKDYRGGERQTELLIRALAGSGLRQMAVVRRGSLLATRLRDARPLEIKEIARPFVRHAGLFSRTTLIHAHDAQASQLAFLANRLHGSDYIITRRVPNRPKNNWFTHGVYRHARLVIALSGAIARVMASYEPRATIKVIPSMTARFTVDRDKVARIRRKFTDCFLVGQVGALVMHHKGQQHLVAAARILREQAPDITFLLLGSGNDEMALRRQAEDLPNVCFAGYQDNIADYIAACDLLVFPSLHEGLGSTLLDAMDLGVPIVASRVGGIPEIVRHEHNGILVPPGGSAAIATAVLRLRADPALRERFIANGREVVRAYYPEAIADRYQQVYRELYPTLCA